MITRSQITAFNLGGRTTGALIIYLIIGYGWFDFAHWAPSSIARWFIPYYLFSMLTAVWQLMKMRLRGELNLD